MGVICGVKRKLWNLCVWLEVVIWRGELFSPQTHNFWEVLFSPQIGGKMGEKVGFDEKLSIYPFPPFHVDLPFFFLVSFFQA